MLFTNGIVRKRHTVGKKNPSYLFKIHMEDFTIFFLTVPGRPAGNRWKAGR